MGVTIGGDAAKNGKNINFLVIMRMRPSKKIGLIDLMNWTRSKKGNCWEQRTKIVQDYCEICLMLHTPSY